MRRPRRPRHDRGTDEGAFSLKRNGPRTDAKARAQMGLASSIKQRLEAGRQSLSEGGDSRVAMASVMLLLFAAGTFLNLASIPLSSGMSRTEKLGELDGLRPGGDRVRRDRGPLAAPLAARLPAPVGAGHPADLGSAPTSPARGPMTPRCSTSGSALYAALLLRAPGGALPARVRRASATPRC